jgi:hypothetical protein
MITARALAEELEAERFSRFGLEQGQMRRACNVILDVLLRSDATLPVLVEALELYPVQSFHVDKEPFRASAHEDPGAP